MFKNLVYIAIIEMKFIFPFVIMEKIQDLDILKTV